MEPGSPWGPEAGGVWASREDQAFRKDAGSHRGHICFDLEGVPPCVPRVGREAFQGGLRSWLRWSDGSFRMNLNHLPFKFDIM